MPTASTRALRSCYTSRHSNGRQAKGCPMRIRGNRIAEVTAVGLGFTIALAIGVGATAARAQGNSPVQAIFAILEQVQANLRALDGNVRAIQQSVNTLQQSVDKLVVPGNVLFTPVINVQEGSVGCYAVNVTNQTRILEVFLVDGITGIAGPGFKGTLDPGKRTGVGAQVPGGWEVGVVYCRFVVLDGVKSDIRANLTLAPPFVFGKPSPTTTVSVAAH